MNCRRLLIYYLPRVAFELVTQAKTSQMEHVVSIQSTKSYGMGKKHEFGAATHNATSVHRHDGAIDTLITSYFHCSKYQSNTTTVEQSFNTMINRPVLGCDKMSASYGSRFDVE